MEDDGLVVRLLSIFVGKSIYFKNRRYILKIADIFGVVVDMFKEEKAKGDVTADISFFMS
ncbi:hypothetical protein AAG068_02010 [Bacillus paramycoides]|uniref:hypothetical protein n=1 Tax=Bacillus paramycoides TaxID=2026194 RepID=UPI00318388CC